MSDNMKNKIETNGYMDLKKINTIAFPHTAYELTSDDFHSVVLWTSFKTNEEGKKIFSQDFCCIEPIIGWPGYFGTKKSILKRGKTKSVTISLSAALSAGRIAHSTLR